MMRITIVLSFFLMNLLLFSTVDGQKFDNEILSIDISIPGWIAMTEQQLKEREEYAFLNAGRSIDYIAGYNHESGFPYVLLQSVKMDMTEMTPRKNMDLIKKNSEGEVHIDSIRPYVSIHPADGLTLFNVANKCGVTKYNIMLDNTLTTNISYLLLHGQGHVYMQSFTPPEMMNQNFLIFEKIRKAIEWKVPLGEDGPVSIASRPDNPTPVQRQNNKVDTEEGTSWAKWVVLGVIVLLLFLVLIKNLKKRS